MDCPKCAQKDVDGPSCPRCGVVFAKLRVPPAPSSEPPLAYQVEEPTRRGGAQIALWFGLFAAAVAVLCVLVRPGPRAQAGAAALPVAPAATRPDAEKLPPPRLLSEVSEAPVAVPSIGPQGLGADDLATANRLSTLLSASPPQLSSADLEAAEGLRSRHPDLDNLARLVEAVVFGVGASEARAQRFPPALGHLRRAAESPTYRRQAQGLLLDVFLQTNDLAQAESMAREVLSTLPHDGHALGVLGYCLYRQDRNREALDALEAAVAAGGTDYGLIANIRRDQSNERGMREQHLAHFNVRYDGAAHEDVGREILRALEHHYATLASRLDLEPQQTIPVILYSQRGYYDATGAPAWSGGEFDQQDGRIRIPIGGLTSSLTSDLDDVLIHELTHAFIHERSAGTAPRMVHEGLAQYMEGKRSAEIINQGRVPRDPGLRQVMLFYLGSLSFVEYLEAARGQGGLNDLLKAMGETHSSDQGFRQVYGRGEAEIVQAWQERFKQQNGI